MIYASQITPAIEALQNSGVNVYKEDYVIIAGLGVVFSSDVFPLEIVTHYGAPVGVVYLAKRPAVK